MISLIGATGYIGQAFYDEIVNNRGLGVSCISHKEAGSFKNFCHYLCETSPDLVINSAAFVTKPSVDLCEDHKEETLIGNSLFPVIVAMACEATNTPLIHVSTGCLYNGENLGYGYSEMDKPQLTFDQGAGFYVGAKALAEPIVARWEKSYVCRIRIPFDHVDSERNYLSKLQRYPKVYNGRNSLAHRGDFVRACLDLYQRRAPFGTYNVVNVGSVSAQECCIMIRRILKREQPFEYWDEDEFMTKVARTKKSNCTLDVSKLLATGVKMRTVHEAVEDSLRNWIPEKAGQPTPA